MADDVAGLTAVELRARLDGGTLTALAVADALLARVARDPHDLDDLVRRAGEHHERRARAAVGQPVRLVDQEIGGVGEDVLRADDRFHPLREGHGAAHRGRRNI